MRPGKIALLVVGSIAALLSLGMVLGGVVLVGIHATQRDDAGFYSTSTERFDSPTFALTSERIDLSSDVWGRDWDALGHLTARIVAAPAGGGPVFVGIASAADVDRYLSASAHEELTDVRLDPFDATYRRSGGEVRPEPPATQHFWVASATGPGRQTLTWDIDRGEWDVVIMNADASPGVAVDASVGAKTGLLLPIGLGLFALGLLVGAVAATVLVVALRKPRAAGAPEGAAPTPAPPGEAVPVGAYPVRLDGRLDEPLSRWLWLVKWFLAIPHFIVLAFLWAAFAVLTVVAGLAVLFTGRYPRGIFDFNVGVLRWTWRVTFYAFTLGTDRYPPFTLDPDPSYPAQFSVPYPETLSRGLVLVKWWLLALPHYLVVSVFGGGLTWWTWSWAGRNGRAVAGAGLIGLLVLIAAVVLAVRGRYPRQIFEFVMGMQRWTYRVWAYAALLRDEYPPFRLDNGGADPASPVPTPVPPSPTRDGSLVS